LEANEWKLHTDIVAFEQELRRFILRYPEPLELQNWFPRGLVLPLLDLLAGSLPQPMADRALQIRAPVFRLHKHWPWLQLSVQLATMRLCRVSDDRTTMQIAAQSDAGQVFVEAFIRRCQELWDATRLSPAVAANHATDEQPIDPGAQLVETELTTASLLSSQAERKKRTAQLSTAEKLDRLRALRHDRLKASRVDIGFTTACNQIGIDPKTVLEHEPELRRRWDDPTYEG
jgi:hypothetical protein